LPEWGASLEITLMAAFNLRAATAADVPTLHRLMRDFAVHERAQERFQITEAALHSALFTPHPPIYGMLAICDGEIVGFALWFLFFGTFSGRHGLWVENIYVEESFRGIGIGLALFRHMARIAVDMDCYAIQWDVNEWNMKAIQFYNRIGATTVSATRLMKGLHGEALTKLATE
jgi:GNAT superfamily N-acetyltransferase